MEMSAQGNVGFKELYADKVISESVAAAYDGPATSISTLLLWCSSEVYFRLWVELSKR